MTTTTITATNPPRDNSMLPLLDPEAPAALPSAADPGAAPALPALASSPPPVNVCSVARGNGAVVVVAILYYSMSNFWTSRCEGASVEYLPCV